FLVSPPQFINSDRFKATLQLPDVDGPFIWNPATLKFDRIEYGGTNINPLKIDYLQCCLEIKQLEQAGRLRSGHAPKQNVHVRVTWNGLKAAPAGGNAIFVLRDPQLIERDIRLAAGKCTPMLIRLSHYWRWYAH